MYKIIKALKNNNTHALRMSIIVWIMKIKMNPASKIGQGLRLSSKSLKIRLYSSVQLLGSTKPWFSTG